MVRAAAQTRQIDFDFVFFFGRPILAVLFHARASKYFTHKRCILRFRDRAIWLVAIHVVIFATFFICDREYAYESRRIHMESIIGGWPGPEKIDICGHRKS